MLNENNMNEKNILSHQLMWRIVRWNYNRYPEESLTEECFIKIFGGCFGKHFYSKWVHTYEFDFMKMVGYFGTSTDNGQKFCDMVMETVEQYEQRQQIWKQKN
jgi:hypothetical protein